MSYTEARSHFEQGRLNTVDKGVIEMLDGLNHSCEEITVTTPLNHKVKVRMKNLRRRCMGHNACLRAAASSGWKI